MTLWHSARFGRLLLASAVFWTTGCVLSIPLTRPEEDVTPALPAAEGNPADTDRSLSNTPPKANAGPDATYDGGEQVLLDGTRSTDADGDTLAHQWQQVGGTPTVEFLSGNNASLVEFTAPTGLTQAVTLTFRLQVGDGFASDTDDVRITIRP